MNIELTNEENEILQKGLYFFRCHYLKFRLEHEDKIYQDFCTIEEKKIDNLMKKLIESEDK